MKWEYLRVWSYYGACASNDVSVIGNDGNEVKWKMEKGEGNIGHISRLLEKLGNEGWELSGVSDRGGSSECVLFFKRPKILEVATEGNTI